MTNAQLENVIRALPSEAPIHTDIDLSSQGFIIQPKVSVEWDLDEYGELTRFSDLIPSDVTVLNEDGQEEELSRFQKELLIEEVERVLVYG